MRGLPSNSVHCVVTSPPYWGLRDYGGGVEDIGAEEAPDCLGWGTGTVCGGCYVCRMIAVFREVRRVLRDDGSVWLNLGDSYSSSGGHTGQGSTSQRKGRSMIPELNKATANRTGGMREGNLIGVPWRVALGLQDDGWILRNDIIWYAPNKMPESVDNRCTKTHEHIFLLVKGNDYYFDHVTIQEDGKCGPIPRSRKNGERPDETKARGGKQQAGSTGRVNKRDVWVVPTKGYAGAHYAAFSPELITPCILAGTSAHGCCAECGGPYQRVSTRVGGIEGEGSVEARDRSFPSSRNGMPGSGSTLDGQIARRETVGWRKACGCQTEKVVPAVVLDPFVGSGTTVATALSLGRAGVGIDLSREYLDRDAIPRIVEVMLADPAREATNALPKPAPPPSRRLRENSP